jgi:hypothetical protein
MNKYIKIKEAMRLFILLVIFVLPLIAQDITVRIKTPKQKAVYQTIDSLLLITNSKERTTIKLLGNKPYSKAQVMDPIDIQCNAARLVSSNPKLYGDVRNLQVDKNLRNVRLKGVNVGTVIGDMTTLKSILVNKLVNKSNIPAGVKVKEFNK